MNSLQELLDMVVTEAVEGPEVPEDHADGASSIDNNRPEQYPLSETELPPIRFDLELIQERDGTYRWVE